MHVDYMARHSDRPKPGSTTLPAFTPVKKRQSMGSIKPVNIRDLGAEQEAPKSHCVVCSGEIVDSQENKESQTRHSMTKTGYHCSKCGIAYAFLPPKLKKR
jgi:hypothetical protein